MLCWEGVLQVVIFIASIIRKWPLGFHPTPSPLANTHAPTPTLPSSLMFSTRKGRRTDNQSAVGWPVVISNHRLWPMLGTQIQRGMKSPASQIQFFAVPSIMRVSTHGARYLPTLQIHRAAWLHAHWVLSWARWRCPRLLNASCCVSYEGPCRQLQYSWNTPSIDVVL